MEYVNEIILTSEDFGNGLWDVVAQQLKILCRAQYIATVYDDDTDIIVIKYSYKGEEYGSPIPEWLTPEERDTIWSERNKKGDCNDNDNRRNI